jgi:hypothetical protein
MSRISLKPAIRSRRTMAALVTTGVAAASVGLMAPAFGSTPSNVLKYGKCTLGGIVDLNLQHSDPGYLEAGFELDNMHPGSTWLITLKHDGVVYYHGYQKAARDGSLSVDRTVRNLAGTDWFSGSARNVSNGNTCTVSASI